MLDRSTLRLHGVALAVASWLVLAWSQAVPGAFDRFGTLRGVDFLQFYAAGWFIRRGQASSLYDWDTFMRTLPQLAPDIGDLLFVPLYPPQTALLFAPLGVLSYLAALSVWTVVSVALYVLAVWLALRALPSLRPYRIEAWSLALGFPPFLQLVAHGQVASVAVLLLVGAWLAFRDRRPLLVGLALGSLAFKPQLGTFALAALALSPSWLLLVGLVGGASAQVLVVLGTLGPGLLFDYMSVVQRVATSAARFEPKIWAMHSLRGAIELLLGQNRLATVCWVVGAAGVVWLARHAWQRQPLTDVRFAVICLVGLLLNPHLYGYDLILMAVPLACLAAWLVESNNPEDVQLQYLTYGLVWLPLLSPLAAFTHIQLTSPVLIALLWQLGRYRVATTQSGSEYVRRHPSAARVASVGEVGRSTAH